jgi:hypothetical protein
MAPGAYIYGDLNIITIVEVCRMPVRTLIKLQFSCELFDKVMAEHKLHSHWRSHGIHPASFPFLL